MKKVVRLTESDLTRLVRRVIQESYGVDDMEDYRDDFLMKLDFDEAEAFPDFDHKYDKFMDNLDDYIIDSISVNISPDKAVRMIKKEPWFKPYIKFIR